MSSRIAALTLAFFATSANAHDLWVQPQQFSVATNVPLGFTFQVGHGVDRQRWGNGIERIILLQSIFNGQRRDLRATVDESGRQDFFTRFPSPGLHVVAMQSTASFSELPASRFNDYAKEEGLVPIIIARQRNNSARSPGREYYTRRAKALIQVGAGTPANQALATRALGLKLEIVPERNPYTLGTARRLPVRVLYRGRQLANATVKFTDLDNDTKPLGIAVTDRQGRAAFNVPTSGRYMLNVVWSEALTGNSRADFDTTFSSLTFGFAR